LYLRHAISGWSIRQHASIERLPPELRTDDEEPGTTMTSENTGNLTDDLDEVEDLDDVDEYDDEYDDEEEDDLQESGVVATGDATIDELANFVEFMVSNLVEDPDAYRVVPERLGANVHIKVIVPEEEMGRVIGRQGRIARSMRTLLTIAASRKGIRASLDIDS
jgi:predicted RNA-binding protein YlqC (UPF0109 family)